MPSAKPEVSDLAWMELRSCADWMSVLPPSCAARMEVFHLRPSGPLLCLNRSSVDSRAPSASAALMPCLSISEKLLDPAEHRPRVAVEPDAVHGHALHPPHLLAGKQAAVGLDLKTTAAALAGSSVSVPMDTVPSATSVRNLIAAL